jgi:hypothetical protein
MLNPEFYQTPLNKTPIDLNGYLSNLMSQKEALENEKQTLTNQD